MYPVLLWLFYLEKRNEETDVTLDTSTPIQDTTEHRVIANNLG